jgi:hypothetical protein
MSRKIYAKASHGLGHEKSENIFAKNHFASSMAIPHDVQDMIDRYTMSRVAGNVYECPSTKDFWKVQGNKIVKLVGNEVNQGESIPAASSDKPAVSLASWLDELEF